MVCSVLDSTHGTLQYSHIYSQDIHTQLGITQLFVRLLDLRDKLLEEQETLSATAPLHLLYSYVQHICLQMCWDVNNNNNTTSC